MIKPALRVLKDYETQKKAGKIPVFNPANAGISGADFWEKIWKELEDSSSKKSLVM
jgi:AGCS family alanine or glycine:cation symporter